MEFTQSVRKLISSVAMILIATGSLLAQTDLIMISGTIKDDGSGRKLPGSVVVVYQDGQKIDTQEVDRNAGYSFELVLGHEYTFSYEREGFTSKKIVIDVTHATEGESQDGYILDLDMSIFKDVEGFDISILEDPMGIGSYNPSSGKFEWDMDYTDRMKQRLENEFNRLAAIEENREKNKRAFDVAMKAGENFMKKKKWQEALASFNEALDLIPDEAEAIEKRDECRAKLDEIAAKDAEKQAEEDAKRAEEEAEAAKKEAERIAREEEAARRRAEAEARRNGNRNNTASDDNSSGDTSDDTAHQITMMNLSNLKRGKKLRIIQILAELTNKLTVTLEAKLKLTPQLRMKQEDKRRRKTNQDVQSSFRKTQTTLATTQITSSAKL